MAKTRKNQKLIRDTSDTPDPLDTSRPLVNRPPEFGDMSTSAANQIVEHVGAAGKAAFGKRRITMDDAVNTRVNQIQLAIAKSGSGPVEGVDWYSQHTQELRDVKDESGAVGISMASVADAAASASQRNSPTNEVAAVASGLHNIANPDKLIHITPQHAEAANAATVRGKPFLSQEDRLKSGTTHIGALNKQQIAGLSQVATTTHTTDSAKAAGGSAKAGDLVHGPNPLPPEFTDVTGRSSSRETSVRVMRNLEGTPISEVWGDAPKLASYRRGMSTASPEEDAYNRSVISRIKDQQSMPGQGTLFSAAEETGFDPSTADTSTAEDYVMNAMTAHESAKGTKKVDSKGKPLTARAAQNVVNVLKGPRGEGITTDITSKQALHAFNNEATARAARQINYSTFGPDSSPLSEHITNKAAQAISWTQYRRHELGEDDEYNAAQRAAQESADQASKQHEEANPRLF